MATNVGASLSHEPTKLRFTTAHTTDGKAKSVIDHRLNPTVAEIVSPSLDASSEPVIFYEQLDVSVTELEAKRSLNVIWTGIHDKERTMYPLSLSKTSKVHELIGELLKQVQLTPMGTGKIRVFGVAKDGKTQNEFTGSEAIGDIPDPIELFAEEIPREESV